jgi:hypothetical protein
MKPEDDPSWNQGRNTHHNPERDRDIVLTLLLILAPPAALIALVNLLVWLVKP